MVIFSFCAFLLLMPLPWLDISMGRGVSPSTFLLFGTVSTGLWDLAASLTLSVPKAQRTLLPGAEFSSLGELSSTGTWTRERMQSASETLWWETLASSASFLFSSNNRLFSQLFSSGHSYEHTTQFSVDSIDDSVEIWHWCPYRRFALQRHISLPILMLQPKLHKTKHFFGQFCASSCKEIHQSLSFLTSAFRIHSDTKRRSSRQHRSLAYVRQAFSTIATKSSELRG